MWQALENYIINGSLAQRFYARSAIENLQQLGLITDNRLVEYTYTTSYIFDFESRIPEHLHKLDSIYCYLIIGNNRQVVRIEQSGSQTNYNSSKGLLEQNGFSTVLLWFLSTPNAKEENKSIWFDSIAEELNVTLSNQTYIDFNELNVYNIIQLIEGAIAEYGLASKLHYDTNIVSIKPISSHVVSPQFTQFTSYGQQANYNGGRITGGQGNRFAMHQLTDTRAFADPNSNRMAMPELRRTFYRQTPIPAIQNNATQYNNNKQHNGNNKHRQQHNGDNKPAQHNQGNTPDGNNQHQKGNNTGKSFINDIMKIPRSGFQIELSDVGRLTKG